MKKFVLLLFLLVACVCYAQVLKPEFDINEYREMIKIASSFNKLGVDSVYKTRYPKSYKRLYISPSVGFDNAWELWRGDNGVDVVSLRGSIPTAKSWAANFHSGMVSAIGKLHLGRDYDYHLADDTAACVHVGWLGGMLAMSDDIMAHVDSCYKAGQRNLIITGHSQGGAIAYLLTAYVRWRQEHGLFPKDMVIKTYCSAAPKPGNYEFACYYEHVTRGGWAYNVVNADDWVPQTPLTIQRVNDFNPTNPFTQIDALSSRLGAGMRMKLKFLFSRIRKPTDKSEANWRKYMGEKLGGMLEAQVPEYVKPELVHCADFVRTGNIIVLLPDEDYHARHPKMTKDTFEHHMFVAYLELAAKYVE